MLTTSFCEQHRVVLTKGDQGDWCLNYQPPLLPWVYLYVSRKYSPILLRQVSQDTFEELLQTSSGDVADVHKTLGNMVAGDSLSWMLENLPEEGLDALENNEAPIVRLINTMLEEAISHGASDIHVETFQHFFQVRYRIDGVMQEISKGDARLGPPLISRLKIMSKLDIAEKRLPQDGRFPYTLAQRDIDVRLSIIPVNYGERAVLRLLDQQGLPPDFCSLGIPEYVSRALSVQIRRPHGIILVTGPTGSGKSSTLYAALQQLNQSTRTILTIEDPVEYKLTGVGQTQVNSRIDLNFAKGLRALLRQDPDVIMIGEIRDNETARVAVQASLTGHLVFSTLHTSSAAGAVARLCDMGIEPWLLASSLTVLLAQRLVRKLCTHCRAPFSASEQERRWLNIGENEAGPLLYKPVGCSQCGGRGFSGRTGIYEMIVIDHALRELIQQRASTDELERYARNALPGLGEDGRQKILSGITSIDEVMRVVEENV